MSIRMLRPGETVPEWKPRRYAYPGRYIRLRWRIGSNEYVEAYEHRVVAGVVTDDHVHHLNGDIHDNRPENLEIISAADHLNLHRHEFNFRWRQQRKAPVVKERRSRFTYDEVELVRLYQEGLSTTQVGERIGIDGSGVSRALKRLGIPARKRQAMDITCDVLGLHYEEKLRPMAIAKRLGISDTPVRRVLDENGIPHNRPGRPS